MTDQRTDSFVPGGPPADESPDLRTDDFGVGEGAGDLRKQLLTALESKWNADDPGATTIDEPATEQDPPSADTAATPAPAPDPATTDPQGQSTQDGAGGGRAAEDGQGAAASPPAADAPAPGTPSAPDVNADFDAAAYFNDYFGTKLDREQAQHLAGLIGGLQSLSPDQRAELDRVLAEGRVGQYPATLGVPAQPAVAHQTAPGTLTQPSEPNADPAVALLGPRPTDDDYLASQWDMNARLARAQHEQMTALQQEVARTTQMEQQRQYEANAARIDAATTAWREKYPVLSDAEFDAMQAEAARSGTFPALVHKYHGDVTQAVDSLFEQQLWTDPKLRERILANVASGRTLGDPTTPDPNSAIARDQQELDNGRRALAGSVAGGGGSITPQSTGVPTDPDKKKQALVQEIAAGHDFT